ncbi:MvdD family ATP-grasp ribosomal peptide maturase [Pseudoflavitalea sp. X16]|uniref:MvdC/MvdD family ATP grasp protein n=1 Tax=Paraflavitalea devenefica TaxID=2716334 RepID=UPI0014203863|nr:MvdD family ATP-grasp ribosomal peptide maturase [Paraflavitalea devenefica]NII28613.1 MvdD family ATP-grasp ribosomal peptide maturase [Paraflavitalea devenefica]
MAKQKILIVTHSADNTSTQIVINHIIEADGEAIRFDVDRYPLETSLTTSFQNNRWRILLDTGNTVHDLEDVTAVWYRRSFNLGKGLQTVIDQEYLRATVEEVKRTLMGMLEGLNCFHMARHSVYRRLDSKEEQLKVAVRNGLLIPDTCISNSPEQVHAFIQQQERGVITKMQSSFAIYREAEEHVVFTNAVTVDHLQELNTLRYCPMVFQQQVEKKLELRVTIVGRAIFAFSIDSQKVANAQVDWRKEGVNMVNDWQPYTLPDEIQAKLLSFMDDYGLNYGAIDLILSPDDQYYFLEVNAAGEFFWLDRLCNHAISRQIAAVLMGTVPRR